ncbi:unnamed protein product [Angiostrongylus costaricensis]|uniref:Uncharacterized protein n=1 Tax=Angiostrongylus costaricensis TaxID=334426 RepID=A0A0R3PHU0_ANGCS|nr:unnamed protein product [Angiostrongylus costaricensis]
MKRMINVKAFAQLVNKDRSTNEATSISFNVLKSMHVVTNISPDNHNYRQQLSCTKQHRRLTISYWRDAPLEKIRFDTETKTPHPEDEPQWISDADHRLR